METADASKTISPERLQASIQAGEPLFILDVRNEQDYNDWKIEGRQVRSVNIPYFDFLEEDESVFADIPKLDPVVVVCAKGGSAAMVAELLEERGHTAYTLESGMLGWSRLYAPVTVHHDERLTIRQVNRLSKGCLSYVIHSHGQAMIVDPGSDIEVYLQMAEQEKFEIRHIVDTHLHADHISGGTKLAEATGATYYISSGEARGSWLKYEPLERYDAIKFGHVQAEVLAIPTPGHTPGSTSFLINNRYLLSGDTVFVGGLGRPDLGGKTEEWAGLLYETVFDKLSALPDSCVVLPAHYAAQSEVNDEGIVAAELGRIREKNDIMHSSERDDFIETVAGAASTEKPPNFEQIIAINRGELAVSPEQAVELEIGPNRCAVHHQH